MAGELEGFVGKAEFEDYACTESCLRRHLLDCSEHLNVKIERHE